MRGTARRLPRPPSQGTCGVSQRLAMLFADQLHQAFGVTRVFASSYQAVSGTGAKAIEDSHLKRVAPSALRHRLRRNPLDDTGSHERVQRCLQEVLG